MCTNKKCGYLRRKYYNENNYYYPYYSSSYYPATCRESFFGESYRDCWIPQRGYFIGRGLYIGLICYIISKQLNIISLNVSKWFNGRVIISKILIIPMIIYSIFIASIIGNGWGISVVAGCWTYILTICLIIGLFIVSKANNKGTCGMTVFGGFLWTFYILALLTSFVGILVTRLLGNEFAGNKVSHNPIKLLFYELGIVIMSIPNMWILLQSIHPKLADSKCQCDGCCK